MRGSAAFRTGVAPGGALAGPWVRDPLWTRARAVPSLDLRFADNKSLVDAVTGASLVTFTRASSGTFVGSDGVLRTAVTNLLLQSEDFSTTWSTSTASITTNAGIAPNGTTTADKLIVNSGSSSGYVAQNFSFVSGTNYAFSVYVKSDSASDFRIVLLATSFGTTSTAIFNLTSGTVASSSGVWNNVAIVAVGNNWYRVTGNATATATASSAPRFQCNVTGDGVTGILLWGAQLEQASTVGEYIPTTSTINSAPRFDHNPTTGESLGLLVEEARTNSIRNNTMVGAVAGTPGTLPTNWTIGGAGVGTLSRTISVGEQSGISYVDIRYSGTTSTTGFIFAFEPPTQIAALTGQTWTNSIYLALVGGSTTNINSLRHDVVERTLVGGTVLQNFSSDFKSTLTANLTRSTYSVALSGGATTAYAQPSIEFSFASGVAIDITLRIGLPQFEQGAFATSVIPTTTTTVTRAADVASITGSNFSSWYNQTEGSMYVDGSTAAFTGTTGFVSINNAGNTNRLEIRQGRINPTVTGAGTSVTWTTLSSPTLIANTSYKQAVAFSSASHSNSIAGVLTNTSSTEIPAIAATQLIFGVRDSQTAPISGSSSTIKRLAFWPTRLSNEVSQRISQP